jgi:hypothetical protein
MATTRARSSRSKPKPWGYPVAWLGFGPTSVADLAVVEQILRATSTIVVATAIVNMWTNDAEEIAASYRALRLAAARTLGSHPYLVVPDHTRDARRMLGPDVLIAPEQTVVVGTDPDAAREIGRAFVSDPYLALVNYTNNYRRYGYTDDDLKGRGSDRLIDASVLHGSADSVAAGLRAHLEAGADHIGIQVLTANGENPMPGYRQLAHALL